MSLMVTRERFQPIIDQLVDALFGPTDTMKEFLRPVVKLCFAPLRAMVRREKTGEDSTVVT
jgi:hypothetical protein